MTVQLSFGKPQFRAYLVAATTTDGDNADLFVISDDPAKVEGMWRKYLVEEWEKEEMEVDDLDMIRVLPWAKVQGPSRCLDWAECPTNYHEVM